MVLVTGLEGGVSHNFDGRCHNSILPYLSHSAAISHFETARTLPTREKGGDVSDPPQKRGGMWPWIAGVCHTPLSGPMGVAHVLIYPCGKA